MVEKFCVNEKVVIEEREKNNIFVNLIYTRSLGAWFRGGERLGMCLPPVVQDAIFKQNQRLHIFPDKW